MIAAIHVWESKLVMFRRVWRTSLLAAVFQPLVYLVGLGIGVGTLVDRSGQSGELLGGMSYLSFVAPALIAAAVMNVSASDSLWPLLDGFKWGRSYHAMIATPLTPAQVAGGIGLWHATKAFVTASGVALVLLIFEETRSPGLMLAVLFGVLTGLAFAMPISAWSSTREDDDSFPAILRFGIIPMFLFGGIFFPIEQLPKPVALVAQATPIYNGVELTRGAVLGSLSFPGSLLNIAVLGLYATAGFLVARVTFGRRLTP
jgi:lipooligosaccharide transport system permease protein